MKIGGRLRRGGSEKETFRQAKLGDQGVRDAFVDGVGPEGGGDRGRQADEEPEVVTPGRDEDGVDEIVGVGDRPGQEVQVEEVEENARPG